MSELLAWISLDRDARPRASSLRQPQILSDTIMEPLVRFIDSRKGDDGRVDAVRALNLEVANGEFLTLLGPSGSGNAFVVNIGDSMRMWTNNRFASTLHRVVNHYGRERYSVGVFANPDYDTIIRPLPTCVDSEHPPTFDKLLSGEALLFLYSRVWPSKGEPDKVSAY